MVSLPNTRTPWMEYYPPWNDFSPHWIENNPGWIVFIPLQENIYCIMSIYTNLDQTFGFYFVYCFTVFQLTWIIVLYLGVSVYFSKYETQFGVLFGAGSLTTALAGEHDY